MKRLKAGVAGVAIVAAFILTLFLPGAGSASLGWIEGSIKYSTVTNWPCFVSGGINCSEPGVNVYVAYYGDISASNPEVGEVYDLHVVLYQTGNPVSGGSQNRVEIKLPPATSLAISPQIPVRCGHDGAPFTTDCPQSLPASSLNPGYLVIPTPNTPNDGELWPLATGHNTEFLIPVVTSSPIYGATFQAMIKSIDGESNPWLNPTVGVNVFPQPTPGPTGSMQINNGAVYSKTTAVTLNSAVSNATQMRFQNDGGAWSAWQAYAPAKAWTLNATNGTRTVNAQYYGTGGTITRSDTIILDTVAPAGAMKINNGAVWTKSRAVNLNSAVTGAAQMRFLNAGGAWSAWQAYAPAKAWTLTTGNGKKTVYAQYRDAAGNVIIRSDTIVFDNVPPAGALKINNGATLTRTRTVTLNSAVTGAAQMRFLNAGGAWSAWQAFAPARAWTLTAGSGTKAVYAQYRDPAGNISTRSDTILLQP